MKTLTTLSNREFQSSAFSLLYREPEYALELYNVLNHSAYTDPGEVEILLEEGSVVLTVRNDASFIVDTVLSLLEHQSTHNPNMPLRFLIYAAALYRKLADRRAIFGRRLVRIPEPRFIVFYTGGEGRPASEELRLSDAYAGEPDSEPWLELRCTVYNLNAEENRSRFAESRSLMGFLTFIGKVREYQRQADEDRDAVAQAIDYCIHADILPEFFRKHKEEIMNTTALDLTYERQLELIKQDYEEEKKKEIAYLKKQLRETEAKKSETESRLSETESRLSESESRLRKTESRLEEAETELHASREMICAMQEELASLKEEITALKNSRVQ